MEKKELDPLWIKELIDYVAGPFLITFRVKTPLIAEELMKILTRAVVTLYETETYPTTMDWVRAAEYRVGSLVQLYTSSRLCKLMDDGMPDSGRIITTH